MAEKRGYETSRKMVELREAHRELCDQLNDHFSRTETAKRDLMEKLAPLPLDTEMVAINDLLSDFDFQMVHEMMVAARWEWVDNSAGMEAGQYKKSVPTANQIKDRAQRLLLELHKDKSIRTIVTGGLTAIREVDPEYPDDNKYTLRFSIEQDSYF